MTSDHQDDLPELAREILRDQGKAYLDRVATHGAELQKELARLEKLLADMVPLTADALGVQPEEAQAALAPALDRIRRSREEIVVSLRSLFTDLRAEAPSDGWLRELLDGLNTDFPE